MSVLAFNILYPLVMMLIIVIPISIFCGIPNKRLFSLYIVIYYLLISFFLIKNLTNYTTLIQIFIPFTYLYLSCKKIVNSILIPLLTVFITAISDSIIGVFLLKVLHKSYIDVKSDLTLYFITGVLILFLTFIISKLTKILYLKFIYAILPISKTAKSNRILIINTIAILLLLVLFIFTLKFSITSFDNNFIAAYSISVFAFLIIILAAAFFSLHYMKLYIKKDFIDKENKQLKEYSNMLENMSTDLRRFKHDYVNILSTLGEFINEEDIIGLKEYYKRELLPESNKIINRDKYISLLKNIKITPLKALISSKIIYAQSRGIDTRIEILDEIYELPIRTFDICRIIGIFLDNAIEATLLCDKKYIHLAIVKNDDSIIIVILNSCLEDSPPVYRIYDKDFSTKGTNRGIGLKTVKDMLNSNYKNILLNTTIDSCIFKQELIISKSDN